MSLVFEYEKDLSTGAQPFISHEPNSILYNYYINNGRAMDKNTSINNGSYDEVAFADEQRHLTTKAVSRMGIKNFPGIGGIGFYKDLYSDESRILAPIHSTQKAYNAPILKTLEIVDDKLHIVITPPDNIKYTCYRIVVRQNAFAFEYIVYSTDYYVELPTVKGDYIAYCMGYDEDNGTVSEDSNELTLNVSAGIDTWSPYFESVASLEQKVTSLETVDDDLEISINNLETRVDAIDEVINELNNAQV